MPAEEIFSTWYTKKNFSVGQCLLQLTPANQYGHTDISSVANHFSALGG